MKEIGASGRTAVAGPDIAPAKEGEGYEGRTKWHMLVALMVIFSISSIDRGLLSLLVEPIRADLNLSDVQMSLLLGFSFVALFTVCSIPAGYLADIFSRRVLVATATVFWSCMSIVCGFANGFWQLFLGRLGLGAGEAVLPPSAYSLLRDGIRTEHRARAFGVYHMAPILGRGLGNWGGGLVFGLAVAGAFHGWPLLGELRPWQVVFVVAGLVGTPLASLMFIFREPARTRAAGEDAPSFADLFRHISANRRAYIPVYAAIFFATAGNGWNAWLPAALGRTWGLTPADIGAVLGPLSLITGPAALLTMGWLMDRYRRVSPDAAMRIALIATGIHTIPTAYALLAPSIPLMWASVAGSLIFDGAALVATSAALTLITPTRLMGKATAFYAVAANAGAALGPTLFASVAQYGFSGDRALSNALTLCYPLVMGLTMFALWAGGRELLRAQHEQAP